MYGNETIITSKDGVVHRFYYDHCFWSFDSRHTDFADQEKVYKDLAQPLLDRSFEGYNTCLFAYGQVSREERGREEGRGKEGRDRGGGDILTVLLSPHRLDQESHTGELNVSLSGRHGYTHVVAAVSWVKGSPWEWCHSSPENSTTVLRETLMTR